MTSREEVKWVEGASSFFESQMKRELKIYVSRFVLNSGASLVGVISTAAFLLKWARRNSWGESFCCCLRGPHSDRDMRSGKKMKLEVMVSFMQSCNLAQSNALKKDKLYGFCAAAGKKTLTGLSRKVAPRQNNTADLQWNKMTNLNIKSNNNSGNANDLKPFYRKCFTNNLKYSEISGWYVYYMTRWWSIWSIAQNIRKKKINLIEINPRLRAAAWFLQYILLC